MNNTESQVSIKKFFGLYDTDGEGRETKLISLHCFKSLAEKAMGDATSGYYKSIRLIECIVLDNEKCLPVEQAIKKESVLSNFPILAVSKAYSTDSDEIIYSYSQRVPKEEIRSEKDIITHIKKQIADHKRIKTITPIFIFRDGDNYWRVPSPDMYAMPKFLSSRQLAIEEALNKLTEEDRKVLGV